MLYNVKMRAEKNRQHISGAERLVSRNGIQEAVAALAERALKHPHGEPDALSVSVKRIECPVRTVPALRVTERCTRTPEEACRALGDELRTMGLAPEPILKRFYSLEAMRGAVLLDVHTLQRLEPDARRGVRVTCMDYTGNTNASKNHRKEALCLASKVASHPRILGELCMSDDPDYTTGYFASRSRGYIRLEHMKGKGDARGGRIFLFDGATEEIAACIRFLEETPILVDLE